MLGFVVCGNNMYNRYATKTILTSLILVSCVLSRTFDIQCKDKRREGEKWFDGCQWCVCHISEAVCSSSDCSLSASQLSVCHTTGSSWRDGCYTCQCHLNTISCTPDQVCLQLLDIHRSGADMMSSGVCVQPRDERCVCGIDGVPSCTAEVIDKNAFPAITLKLNPAASSLTSLRYQDLVNSNPDLKLAYTKTQELHPGVGNKNYGSPEGHLVDTNSDFLQRIYSLDRNKRVLEGQTRVHSYEMPGQRSGTEDAIGPGDVKPILLVARVNRCRWGERWYGGSLRCYCSNNSVTCGDPNFVASRIDGFRLKTGQCERGRTWEVKDSCTLCTCQIRGVAFCRRLPSCRLPFKIKILPRDTDAARKFDVGSHDQNLHGENELTEPIEQTFMLNKNADKMSAKPSSSTEEDIVTLNNTNKQTSDFENVDKEAPKVQQSFQEESTFSNNDDIDGFGDSNFQEKTITSTEDDFLINTSAHLAILTNEKRSIKKVVNPDRLPFEALNVDTRSNTMTCEPKTKWTEDGCIRCKCNKKGKIRCSTKMCPVYSNTTVRLKACELKTKWIEDGCIRCKCNKKRTIRCSTKMCSLHGNNTVPPRPSDESSPPGESVVQVPANYYSSLWIRARTCRPRTRWIEDGCKLCRCNKRGNIAKCNIKRCYQTTTPASSTTVLLSTTPAVIHPPGRPAVRPPNEYFVNRSGPIDLTPKWEKCKVPFTPGDIYKDECNTCQCTHFGPMCTAMNCV